MNFKDLKWRMQKKFSLHPNWPNSLILTYTYLYLLIPTHTRKTHHHPYPLLHPIASGKTPGTVVRTCGT